MGITAPERAIAGFPHQFSGGMRQRVMLAMGFSNEPALLIADEPTTALDVTIQAQILDLLRELNADFGAAIILISHDLGVIANVCQPRGRHVRAAKWSRRARPRRCSSDPQHPYTWALLNAAPRLDRDTPRRQAAHHDRRHAARSAELADGLPLRAALSVPHREVRRASGAAARRRRAASPLLGHAGRPGLAARAVGSAAHARARAAAGMATAA